MPETDPSTETRYDPESGTLFVPIDLRTEVIAPLHEVRDLARATDARLRDHVASHETEKAARRERRDRLIHRGKLIGTATGGLLSVLLTLHQAGAIP